METAGCQEARRCKGCVVRAGKREKKGCPMQLSQMVETTSVPGSCSLELKWKRRMQQKCEGVEKHPLESREQE